MRAAVYLLLLGLLSQTHQSFQISLRPRPLPPRPLPIPDPTDRPVLNPEPGLVPSLNASIPLVPSRCFFINRLMVIVTHGSRLYGGWGDRADGYVKVMLGANTKQTHTIPNNASPYWWTWMDFGSVRPFSWMRVEMWDADAPSRDDLLVRCYRRLQNGFRPNSCRGRKGTVYFYTILYRHRVCLPIITPRK